MLIQAFVDDSGGKGHSDHFVLAGLVSTAEEWANFSVEWKACLESHPAIPLFKMNEAAARRGAFERFSESARDEKLRELARVINRRTSFMISSVMRMEDSKHHVAGGLKPFKDPYFLPFHTLIMGICLDLWDHGIRQRFEITFDEQVIFGPRAMQWYPLMKEIIKLKERDAATLLPEDPMFRSDDNSLPLQAADLFAWCIRRNTDDPEKEVFGWLLKEMPNVKRSSYSYFMDEERFCALNEQTKKILEDKNIPPYIANLMKQLQNN